MRRIATLMKKSGDEDVPEWMLKLDQSTAQEWRKLEKVPIARKYISTQPKPKAPKRFLKHMEKQMKRRGKMAEMMGAAGDDEMEGDDAADFDYGEEEAGGMAEADSGEEEYVSGDDEDIDDI